ncbi:tRNA(fMet)-specific endonuclease VapC [Rhizobium sp. BIGb0125]|uniref:PIN domain-containing protein n=1 Tax=Rhizobium sp. BIGb0125 TaxID=2940618 RepID=UPI0038679DF0|nr:tRNA(fMet)-specific endonuclease VapC [Rhizobium sp. BIGb0125]
MLDTNIGINTIKDKPNQVQEAYDLHHGPLCISSVSLMDLIYAAEKSANRRGNLMVVESFAARLVVLPYDEIAASHTGQLRAELACDGTPIRLYDQLIAGGMHVLAD